MFLCSAFAAVVAAYAERFTAPVGRPMIAGDATRRVIAARAMIQARISLEGGRGALLECGAFARAVGSVGRALPSHGPPPQRCARRRFIWTPTPKESPGSAVRACLAADKIAVNDFHSDGSLIGTRFPWTPNWGLTLR